MLLYVVQLAEQMLAEAPQQGPASVLPGGQQSRQILVGQLQQLLELAPAAELIEKKLRVEGVKTHRIGALDLPGQIAEGLELGIIDAAEAATLGAYDALAMEVVNVDEFAADDLGQRG